MLALATPSSSQYVQPYLLLNCLVLRTIAFAGKSTEHINMRAFAVTVSPPGMVKVKPVKPVTMGGGVEDHTFYSQEHQKLWSGGRVKSPLPHMHMCHIWRHLPCSERRLISSMSGMRKVVIVGFTLLNHSPPSSIFFFWNLIICFCMHIIYYTYIHT